MRIRYSTIFACLAISTILSGCPKQIPQPEIDAAEGAMADIEAYKDCAPESYQAAKTMMDNARALLKEELYEEAKTALLAAKRLAEKARLECEKKRKEEEERKRLEAAKAKIEPVAKEITVEKTDSGPDSLVTVHFGFNDSSLSDETRSAMGNNAEYLGIHKKIRVQVEGHCDERGSTEYNLSLGERRAMAVKNYLVKLGIEPRRLEIISYGEERPADSGASEDAWAQNRRAEFRELE